MLLGRSQGLCGCSWAVLESLFVVLGRLGSALGCYVGDLGLLLGPMLAVLAARWPLWAVLGRLGLKKVEEYRYLENVLISQAGARSAAWGVILSRSWGLCWLSWATLEAYVGGPKRS